METISVLCATLSSRIYEPRLMKNTEIVSSETSGRLVKRSLAALVGTLAIIGSMMSATARDLCGPVLADGPGYVVLPAGPNSEEGRVIWLEEGWVIIIFSDETSSGGSCPFGGEDAKDGDTNGDGVIDENDIDTSKWGPPRIDPD